MHRGFRPPRARCDGSPLPHVRPMDTLWEDPDRGWGVASAEIDAMRGFANLPPPFFVGRVFMPN